MRQTALCTSVPRSTHGHWLAGRKPRSEITLSSQRLTKEQEDTLFCYIKDLQLQYQPPTHRQIHEIAQNLANQNVVASALGKHWVSRFIQRHPQLQTGRSQPFAIERATAASPLHVKR